MNDSVMIEKKRLMELMLNKKRQSIGVPDAQTIPKRDITIPAELSFAQQRLWFLDELTPGNAAYAFCNIVRFNGEVNVACLEQSFNEIIKRHENLRTTFKVNQGIPYQDILDVIKLPFPKIDLIDVKEPEKEDELQKIALSDARKPFDLSNGPMIRTSFVKLTNEKSAVVITMHHIVYDGWSLSVLFKELKQFYELFIQNKKNDITPLNIQYADFAIWQRKELETPNMQKQFKYWENALTGQLPTLTLPADKKRAVIPDFSGAMEWFYLSKNLTQAIENLARREDCTLFMVLLAAFNILLSRYSGIKDIIVGTPIANRNRKDIEGLIGFFINSLVMRTSLEGDIGFCELLERVKDASSHAYENQDFPFEKLVEDLNISRIAGQNPIFQTMFALQNTPPPPNNISGIGMEIEEVDNGTAVFDITLSMYEDEKGLNGYFEYSKELFDQSTIARIISSFICLLEDITENPEKEIKKLNVINKNSYNEIIYDWNSKETEFSKKDFIYDSIDLFSQNKPNAIAIATSTQTYTYKELNDNASKLANILIAKGVKNNDFIGVCLNRSFETFVSILAVMKAGAAYLPLDPAYPKERLSFMLSDTQAKIVITNKDLTDNLPTNENENIFIDDVLISTNNSPIETPKISRSTKDTAYIIYTSGSTGKPKGVLVSHKNLVHSTTVRQEYYQSPVTSFLLMSSFSFDSSVAGIFWTLCDGGTLVLPENGQEKDIFEVAKLVKKNHVSHMLSLPSVYSLLISSASPEDIKSLKIVCVAGEECPSSLVEKHFKILPKTRLFNEYGPTEGTVWSTVYECDAENIPNIIPIGFPIANMKIYILDEDLNVLPIGVPGEIYISGEGITQGYLHQEKLTQEKFITNPFDQKNPIMYKSGDVAKYHVNGSIEFLGRIDDQVKVRGYRIELGEVEKEVLKNNKIRQCVAIVDKTDSGDSRLITYIETDLEEISFIYTDLENTLPSYMIPSVIVPLKSIPLMPNGKVNRTALPKFNDISVSQQQEYVSTENDIEIVLQKIWAELLEIEKVSVTANFFELGGHSIMATRVVSRIFESFDVQIAIRHLFDTPTIRGITKILLSMTDEADRIQETAELIVQIDEMSEDEIDTLINET